MKKEQRPIFATINPSYFSDNSNLSEMIFKENRIYLGLVIEINSCTCFVPLRSTIKTEARFKKAFFPLP